MRKKQSIIKAILMVSQIGLSMMVPIFLGAFIGYWLDRWLKTGFFFLIFMLFGILAAFRNIYLLTKPFYAEDFKREQAEQAYWDSLKGSGKKEAAIKEEVPGKEAASAGAAARREREQRRAKEQKGEEAGKSDGLASEIEEEFDAWRRRNRR